MTTSENDYNSMQRSGEHWGKPNGELSRMFLEAATIKYPNKEEQFERALKVKKIKLCK